jgi:hypothetical protein
MAALLLHDRKRRYFTFVSILHRFAFLDSIGVIENRPLAQVLRGAV